MMMTDEELLKAAAKAAGLNPSDYPADVQHWAWNPLTDDGDVLRLAVKCEIALHHFHDSCVAAIGARFFSETHGSDPAAAARRAIVRAAAAKWLLGDGQRKLSMKDKNCPVCGDLVPMPTPDNG